MTMSISVAPASTASLISSNSEYAQLESRRPLQPRDTAACGLQHIHSIQHQGGINTDRSYGNDFVVHILSFEEILPDWVLGFVTEPLNLRKRVVPRNCGEVSTCNSFQEPCNLPFLLHSPESLDLFFPPQNGCLIDWKSGDPAKIEL